MSRVFANDPGDQGSTPGRVIPKTQKWYLMPPCLTLSIIRHGSWVKWSNPGNGIVPSPTPWCISYWKGSLQVTLNCSRQLYFYLNWHSGRVFANGPEDQDSIPDWVLPRTQKIVLDASLLNTQYYKVQIKGKCSNPGKARAPSSTYRWSSYWKRSLLVTVNYSWPTHLYY